MDYGILLKIVAILALAGIVITGMITGADNIEVFYYLVIAVIGAVFGVAIKKATT